MKVLFLTEWYPHRYDAMAGLFVRKHAEAVARQGVDVCVLYLHRDKQINQLEIVKQTTNGALEIYVYYPKHYLYALYRGWQEVKRHWGMPDVCQLNVITKNAILPLWLKITRKTPYVIVEHWTGYLPISFTYKGFKHKRLAELTARKSSVILPVSEDLGNAMKLCGLRNKHWQVINNVVDDFFYTTQRRTSSKKRLLHISCFDEPHKNVCGILRAVKQISLQRQDFDFVIVGTGTDFQQVYNYAQTLDFPANMLVWTGEQTPQQVADWFSTTDIFVLFSNTENAPVVISEALATGTPIISSAVGGIPEMINKDCGILVSASDETALTESINHMLENLNEYNNSIIRQYGNKYRYDFVGQFLSQIYNNCLRLTDNPN